MQCVSDVPYRLSADFTVVFARVDGVECRAEIEIRNHPKAKPTLTQISRALPWVERDLRHDNCSEKRGQMLEINTLWFVVSRLFAGKRE